jgi:hypothetical protein
MLPYSHHTVLVTVTTDSRMRSSPLIVTFSKTRETGSGISNEVPQKSGASSRGRKRSTIDAATASLYVVRQPAMGHIPSFMEMADLISIEAQQPFQSSHADQPVVPAHYSVGSWLRQVGADYCSQLNRNVHSGRFKLSSDDLSLRDLKLSALLLADGWRRREGSSGEWLAEDNVFRSVVWASHHLPPGNSLIPSSTLPEC